MGVRPCTVGATPDGSRHVKVFRERSRRGTSRRLRHRPGLSSSTNLPRSSGPELSQRQSTSLVRLTEALSGWQSIQTGRKKRSAKTELCRSPFHVDDLVRALIPEPGGWWFLRNGF